MPWMESSRVTEREKFVAAVLAGEADPVETHVYLTSTESDEVAREMLDISEQTCFLHAFCRTDMKTKLKVVRV